MTKVTEYLLLKSNDSVELTVKVIEALSNGWQPLGVVVSHQFKLVQTMVKYE